ncbi:MAG: exopolyphosphatase [Raineya sp.]|nr:exopolyphosphatase [Raineya sp.]MDW8295736.1 exopolyphosphatase [Raineya sp.]
MQSFFMNTLHSYRSKVKDYSQTAKHIAAIDIGTNTAHLLVVEVPSQQQIFTPFRILHKEKIATKIGEGGISYGFITEPAQERLLKALLQFCEVLEYYAIAPENTLTIATSAFRNASNQKEIIEKIYAKTGLRVCVISGEQEAEYIYYGVKAALKIGKGNSLIMDIGGGSVEFILCDSEKMLWKQSFEIGAQRLLDKFMQGEKITETERIALNDFLETTLQPLTEILQIYPADVLIGCSGTFDTIDDINLIKKHQKLDYNAKESAFTQAEFEVIFQEFLTKNHAERLAIPGMTPMRADMIVVASCLLDFVLRKYKISQIRVSHYSLKEGVIFKFLQENNF